MSSVQASTVAPRTPFSRGALIAAGSTVGIALLAAMVGRLTGPVVTHEASAPIYARDLRFTDQTDGSVIVTDARDGQTVDIVLPGTNGFLRATLRGLARERKHEDIGAQTPFRLTQWVDGRWTLEDPTTHRTIELEAFGETNLYAFTRLASQHRSTP